MTELGAAPKIPTGKLVMTEESALGLGVCPGGWCFSSALCAWLRLKLCGSQELHSTNKYLLSIYYLPGPSRSPGFTVGSEADPGPALTELNAGGGGGCPAVVAGSPGRDMQCTQEGFKRKPTGRVTGEQEDTFIRWQEQKESRRRRVRGRASLAEGGACLFYCIF